RGLTGWQNAVTIISDHDEVGNAERTINVADKNQVDANGVPSAYARGLARFAAGMGFAAPGMPMFFEGDESMASNTFKWGVPAARALAGGPEQRRREGRRLELRERRRHGQRRRRRERQHPVGRLRRVQEDRVGPEASTMVHVHRHGTTPVPGPDPNIPPAAST